MKIAIIGYGGMANYHNGHIIKCLNDSDYSEKLEVVGAYDINPKFAIENGVHIFDSADNIFGNPDIDIVLIATPNDVHLPYVERAIASGKHVILEKPAGLNCAEVEKMYDIAKKKDVVFSPHQNRRWDEDYLSVVDVEKSGILGRVYRIESRVMGSNGIPGEWRKIKSQGGGMMLDWGVHLVDQMLLWIDSAVDTVYCSYSYEEGEEVEDGFDLEVRFKNGVLYRIVVDTNTFIELPRWQLYGTEGTASVSEWQNGKVEGKIVRCVLRDDEELKGVSAGNGFTKTMARRRTETTVSQPLKHIKAKPNAFYENFVDAVRFKKPTNVTEEQQKTLFRVMELAERSALEKKVIKF